MPWTPDFLGTNITMGQLAAVASSARAVMVGDQQQAEVLADEEY